MRRILPLALIATVSLALPALRDQLTAMESDPDFVAAGAQRDSIKEQIEHLRMEEQRAVRDMLVAGASCTRSYGPGEPSDARVLRSTGWRARDPAPEDRDHVASALLRVSRAVVRARQLRRGGRPGPPTRGPRARAGQPRRHSSAGWVLEACQARVREPAAPAGRSRLTLRTAEPASGKRVGASGFIARVPRLCRNLSGITGT